MSDFNTAPRRAITLTLVMGADDLPALSYALRTLADHAERGELSVGVSGGPTSGAIYELLQDPLQTHERYFAQVQRYLHAQDAARAEAKGGAR